MKGHAPISRIYRMGNPPAPDPDAMFSRIWRWCRDLWTQQGTIVAKPSELPEPLRADMIAWANETYGERKDAKKRR